MKYIVISILGVVGLIVCEVIENAMLDYDRDKAFGIEKIEHIKEDI